MCGTIWNLSANLGCPFPPPFLPFSLQKWRGAVPRGWEQQPAGCQRSNRALQRTEGRNRDGRSFLPYRRMDPARPWSGAGQGGKRKASAERGAEPNGKIYAKAVQEVLLERAHLQAGGLPTTAGPSTGGRPSPAVCPRSVSKSLAGCKRKGLEEAKPTAVQLPANKRVRGPSGDSVPAPAAHPGPAAARSSKLRARRRQEKERRGESMKAALRAAAARAEASAVNSLVEMMQKLQLKD
ncbi:uncharacterized protein LOC121108749 isoform X1 [Gallus gallus]|uniref:uncharacterized protein LOC121108738 isoform X1 n=1 Tax=Gallus gallus TaxID=9031 RepID=UPI001AE59C71|nr:uncharacterized protein LOC121108738 isoform X1 [Gallus gallus]XP_040550088.1 uncharacterized protein LOC121108749 isoform X1 [Gallus gallus]